MSEIVRTDVNQVDITSLNHIQGQPQVQKLLRISIDAYRQNNQSCYGPVMLVGPSGTGKTITAKAIHAELSNANLIETNGEMLNNTKDLIAVLVSADDKSTLFIDECQSLSIKAQHLLLTAISERKLYVPKGKSSNSCHSIPLADFALLLASTHEYAILDALRNRMRYYCRFDYYSHKDLIAIVKQRMAALGWKAKSATVIKEIVQRAKQTPRLAINRNLQMVYNVSRSKGNNILTTSDATEAFDLLEVDEQGLDSLERQYLRQLSQYESVQLNVIVSRLGLPRQTICNVVEPYLIRQEFVSKKESCRVITEKGLNHIRTTSFK